MSQPQAELARTPLHDLHLRLGARMVPFAGYAMPLQYAGGIIKEHLHVLFGQILEGGVEAEPVVRGEAIEQPASPAIGTVAHGGLHERSVVQRALRVGHEQ